MGTPADVGITGGGVAVAGGGEGGMTWEELGGIFGVGDGDVPGGMTPAGHAVSLQIQEGIEDYRELMWQLQKGAQLASAEATRKTAQTKTEGIVALQEMATQAAYETKTAFMGAELASSAQEAKLGASGVRASGSPLLAAQQMSDVAWGAASEKGRQAAAGISLGGLKLGGSLQDIKAANSLLTQEYLMKYMSAGRKKADLEKNARALISAADTGQIIDWTKSVLSIGLGFL